MARKVAALNHKVLDDTVEARALEGERLLGGLADALLAGAERTEVLGSARDDVRAQLHDDAARGTATNGDIKKDARQGHDRKQTLNNPWLVIFFFSNSFRVLETVSDRSYFSFSFNQESSNGYVLVYA